MAGIERRVPFWQRGTNRQRRALEAADFRRQAEADVFSADNDPSRPGSFADIVGGKGDEQRRPFADPGYDPSTPDAAPNAVPWRSDPFASANDSPAWKYPGADPLLDRQNGGRPISADPSLGDIGNEFSRPAGAVAAALSADTPMGSVRGLRSGWENPDVSQFRDIGGVRLLNDSDIFAPSDFAQAALGPAGILASYLVPGMRERNLSARDVAGGVAAATLDPLNLAPGVGNLDDVVRVSRRANAMIGRPLRGAAGVLEDHLGSVGRALADERGSIELGSQAEKSRARYVEVDPKTLTFRPEQFQSRRTTPGKPWLQSRVDELASTWNENALDPITVVNDTSTGEQIVTVGHHRTGAALQRGEASLPARVRDYDLSDPAQLKRAQAEAALSNSLVREQDVVEQFDSFTTAMQSGLDIEDVAANTAVNATRVQSVLDMGNAGRGVLEITRNNKNYEGIAEAIGRARRMYPEAINEGTAGGLFERYTKNKRALPTPMAVRQELETFAPQLSQGSMFGDDFGKDALLDAIAESTRLRSEWEKAITSNARAVKSAQRLGKNVGVDTTELEAAGNAKVAELRAQLEASHRDVAAAFANQTGPADVLAQHIQTGPDLFGENPTQGGMMGQADQPTYRPENTPNEQQAGLGIGSGTQPIETAGPMLASPPQSLAPENATPSGITRGQPFPAEPDNPANYRQPPLGDLRAPAPPAPFEASPMPPATGGVFPSGRQVPTPDEQTARAERSAAQGQQPTLAPNERRVPVWERIDSGEDVAQTAYEPGGVFDGNQPPWEPPPPPSNWGVRPQGEGGRPRGTTMPALLEREYVGDALPAHQQGGREFNAQAKGLGAFQSKNLAQRAIDYFASKGQPVGRGVLDAIERAKDIRKPKDIWGIRAYRQKTTPGSVQPEHIFQAWNAEGIAIADVSARSTPSRLELISRGRTLFGEDLARPASVRYIGPAMRSQSFNERGAVVVRQVPASEWLKTSDNAGATGTFGDIIQNRAYYDLTPEQEAFVTDVWNERNARLNQDLNGDYNADIGTYRPGGRAYDLPDDPGFIPSVNANEDIAEALNRGGVSAGNGRFQKRVYPTWEARALEDPEFVPEINVEKLLTGLDAAKARRAGRSVLTAALGVVDERAPGLVNVDRLGGFLPTEEAGHANRMLREFDADTAFGHAVQVTNNLNGAALGGDMGLFTIHDVLGLAASPRAVAKATAGGIARMVREGDALRPFRMSEFAKDVAADPRWRDFLSMREIPVSAGGSTETATGYLGKLPKIGARIETLNEGAFLVTTREQFAIWNKFVDTMTAAGVPKGEAQAAAMENVMRAIPTFSPRRAGLSMAGAVEQRAPYTSLAFTRKPQELLGEGARAMVKLGTGQKLTAQEHLAAKLTATMLGSLVTASVTTGALDAYVTGEDVAQRVRDVLNPDKGTFISLYAPGTGWHAPVGAGFRGIIKAILPQPVSFPGGHEVYMPFGGLFDYAGARIQPAARAALDLSPALMGHPERAVDFRGNRILPADNFPEQLMQGLLYVGEHSIPIFAAEPAAAAREGASPLAGAARTASQFAGLGAYGPSVAEQRATLQRKVAEASGKRGWEQMTGGEQQRALKANPALADELQKVEQQRRDIGASEFAQYDADRKRIDDKRMSDEAALWGRVRSGDDTMQTFADKYNSLQQQAAVAKREASTDYKAMQNGTLPEDPGRRAYVQWLDTWKQAEIPGGVDFEKQAQLEADLRKTLTPRQQQYIDDRAVTNHAPEVKTWLKLRTDIAESGYWDVERRVLGSLEADGRKPDTMSQLEREMRQADMRGDSGEVARLDALRKAANKELKSEREAFREANPAIDRALQFVYGYSPVEESAGNGATITRTRSSSRNAKRSGRR